MSANNQMNAVLMDIAADKLAEQRAEISSLRLDAKDAADRITRLEADRVELIERLKPFAQVAENGIGKDWPDNRYGIETAFPMGALRRALETLSRIQGGSDA